MSSISGLDSWPMEDEPRNLELVVVSREEVADRVVALTLALPSGDVLPPWSPGAHIDLELGGILRQYSLSGEPSDSRTWRIAVLLEPDSRGGSIFAHQHLAIGQTVHATGPRNHFQMVSDSPRYLFLAGGIGITPILPMVRAAESSGYEWELHYIGRSARSMAFLDEVTSLGPTAHTHAKDAVGHFDVTEAISASGPGTVVYSCGPAGLLAAVEEAAKRLGVSCQVEHFVPKEIASVAANEAIDVRLDQTGVTIFVPADRSILEVAEEAGAMVISSCQEGTCGSCETTVLEGTPDHRDSMLVNEQDRMMICVSRALTRSLVLDL